MGKKALLVIVAPLFAIAAMSVAECREDAPLVTKKDLKASKENLKQMGLAAQEYHDAFARMPTNILDKDGKPLLSWRVALLPYLEQNELYKAFKLDEPWDSDHNKKLIEKMPAVYAPVRVKAKAGETFYQMFEGADAFPLNDKNANLTLAVITAANGTSNTGLVYEAGEPVVWTKPADMPFDKKKKLPRLGGLFDGEFHVVFCDGHVAMIKKDPDEETMKCIIMWKNVAPFDFSKLER